MLPLPYLASILLCYSASFPLPSLLASANSHFCCLQIMMYWKIFTLTCDQWAPFSVGASHRKQFTLQFKVPTEDDSKMPYIVGLQLESEDSDSSELLSFFFEGANFPVRDVQRTATNPTYHTLPHEVEGEDDVLHLRRLPDFDGRLRPHAVELLLQYLTVPYLRIPLVLDFFTEDTIYALQSTKLQEFVERVLCEPGSFNFNHEESEAWAEVPCNDRARVSATPFGLLVNELVHSGARLVASVYSLLRLALRFNAYRADDSMRCEARRGAVYCGGGASSRIWQWWVVESGAGWWRRGEQHLTRWLGSGGGK